MKKVLSYFLCLLIVQGLTFCCFAVYNNMINTVVSDTAEYIYETVKEPAVGSIGGEWAVFGLARSGENIPVGYFQKYYDNLEKYTKNCGGTLHGKKYTEYSRAVIALTAIGKNPEDVGGYNLLMPLGDYGKTVWQGINGAIFALIALDCGNYEMPQNRNAKVQATREMYIDYILEKRLDDGGWALSGDVSDPDVTGMALQALAKYKNEEKVKAAIDGALLRMSEIQAKDGGFESFGLENSESCVQMLVALCELEISVDDPRFVKNGNTVLDKLMTYYIKGNGFRHTPNSSSDLMATEQAFYGLVALKRAFEGKSTLYSMGNVRASSENGVLDGNGLSGKHPDIGTLSVISHGRTFPDVISHESKAAVEALACRGIINGKTEDLFYPDLTMTRAEFATIIVRGLGLEEKSGGKFSDVTEKDWFYSFVNTAHFYGIVNGVSETEFNPKGNITREEAAVMVQRAAKLCGMDTNVTSFDARNILAGFSDYVKSSEWAVSSLAFCYGEGILSDSVMEIKPKEAVTRGEIAQMLFNMLTCSKLI